MSGRLRAERSARFETLYVARYRDIAGFVRRRVSEPDADDVIANVFAVAWRRIDHVPEPPGDRLWLFTVARNCVADHTRSAQRRTRLRSRLTQHAPPAGTWQGDSVPAGSDPRFDSVLEAIGSLRPAEREALQLVLWDDLTHAEAASVAGCSANAFEIRYRRARNSVRDAVLKAAADGAPGPTTDIGSSIPVRETTS